MPAIEFSRFRLEVASLYDPPLRRAATAGKIKQVMREFGEICASTEDITPVAIATWLRRHVGRRAATNDSLLRSMRAATNYAVARGYLLRSPWEFRRDWIEPDAEEEPVRHHSIAEIAAVLNLLRVEAEPGEWHARRLLAMTSLFAFTGLRKMEGLCLRVTDADLDRRILTIASTRRRRLKTPRSESKIGIAPDLAEVLATWLPDTGCDWLFPGATKRGPWLGGPPGQKPLDRLKAAGRRAGVDGVTFLSLRHSFATHAQMWGLSPLGLRAILRHTKLRTQSHYVHADEADARELVKHVTFRLVS
ncbi:MAG: site-specific integrase [Planctomycetota bacterium]|nr:site-specific integrase [Planctomycetota bacterium]